jgi:signal transduction protein with GAF and PtsI domain
MQFFTTIAMPRKSPSTGIKKTLNRASQELKILQQISQSISCTLDLDRVLKETVGLVVDVTGCDSCLLYLQDEHGSEPYLFLRASKNPHPRLIGRIAVKVGEGITGWVAENAATVAIPRNASKDERFKVFNNLPEDKYEAFLSIPIIVPPERVVGVINVQHRKTHKHSDRELTMMSIIGHQVGGAIQNAQLYDETKLRSQQLSTVSQIGQIVASGRYLDEMLQLIVNMISQTMSARVCSIMLVDQKKNELVLKAAECSSQEYWKRPNLKIGKSLISRVVKEGKPLMVKDVTREKGYRYPELAKREGVRSLVSMPMIAKDKVIGVINVYSDEERVFSKDDLRVLRTVCDQAALAIENTNLATEVQEREEALAARKIVERARSILQTQLGLSEGDAYRRIRQQSMKSRRTMREIAEAVILSSEIQSG